MERLNAMASVGIEAELRVDNDHEDDVVVVSWTNMLVHEEGFMEDFSFERLTDVAVRMLDVGGQAPPRAVAALDRDIANIGGSIATAVRDGS